MKIAKVILWSAAASLCYSNVQAVNETSTSEEATELLSLLKQISSQFPPDPRFDDYSMSLSTLVLLAERQLPQLSSRWVSKPISQVDHPSVPCGLTNIQVPVKDEHWPDRSPREIEAETYLALTSPFPETADQCGQWEENEDPETILRARTYNVRPKLKALSPLGEDRYSDKALENMVFLGVGSHRVKPIRRQIRKQLPIPLKRKAHSAVLLEHLENLDVRPGFAKLGSSAFFDSQGQVVGIMRQGQVYYPGDDEWDYAKFTFRSSLLVDVVLTDHLVEVHLLAANALVTANVENLPEDHPIRLLLTPFGYRTEAINFNAAISLAPEYGLFHRALALSTKGLEDAYERAKKVKGKFRSIPRRLKTSATLNYMGKQLPYVEDGTDYYKIIEEFVRSYLKVMYPDNNCAEDTDLRSWWKRVSTFIQLPPMRNCRYVEDVLSSFIFQVSALHNHVGNVQHLLFDPRFQGGAWRDGEPIGTPRTAFAFAVAGAATSFDMPKITEDYTHILPSNAAALWPELVEKLGELQKVIEARNANREVSFRSFDPSIIETAVGI